VPLQNRVNPLGELIATPARGLLFGNRGRLHDDQGRIRRPYAGRRWIACRLEFRGRHHGAMPPGRYTGLFFLDEATAFAAGHRPCAECRREDYERFAGLCGARADAIDARLHGERRGRRHERRLDARVDVPHRRPDRRTGVVLVRRQPEITQIAEYDVRRCPLLAGRRRQRRELDEEIQNLGHGRAS
jgi:hypothetical protein